MAMERYRRAGDGAQAQEIRLWWIFTSYRWEGALAIVTKEQVTPFSPSSRETQSIRWKD